MNSTDLKPEAAYDLQRCQTQLGALMEEVEEEAEVRLERWRPWLSRTSYGPSAENLAAYLSLRCRDIQALQEDLTTWGVSSLGHCEPYVRPNLAAAQAALGALSGDQRPRPERELFTDLGSRLGRHTQDLLGDGATPGIMVTLPSEAAQDPDLLLDLLEAGMTAARINLAHDDEAAWRAMLHHLHAACLQTGKSCRVLMDLAGPKVRTGEPRWPAKKNGGRLKVGHVLALGAREMDLPGDRPGVSCTLPEAIRQVGTGQAVWFDDGKLGAVVEGRQGETLLLRVTHAPAKGARLKAGKGINFPDTPLSLPALTDKDRADLAFAAANADMVGYSFVQTVGDAEQLLGRLADLGAPPTLSVLLKIETRLAVQNLADLMVRVAGERPCGVMIARGDLAVELGFARLSEIQEEVLWLAEAAHLPVVWATQVLEGLVKKGEARRAEYTDAAGGVRAECIMLNKGPYVVDAVQELVSITGRMRPHFHKKRASFRALSVARPPEQ
ncbi:pyruvate kinase [Deinococcus sp. MIMF12]|uniref:Pyruvate kinase n=1 Tax=Deinococcus rhizophilus TaxID=3049544 RepID=A0ABT7JFK8_9DEIO|nr:pyruvate kinase [Deinococcus rhizophilus]MDL2343843.1 pyruvate kinase [Deinococcus rhizophilus]